MSQSLESQINKWLRLLKIRVSPVYLKNQLQSHPDYPSLLSITDTLDVLGIENASLVVDKERLSELPVPFLAHMNTRKGDFVLVEHIKKLIEEQPDFIERWDGIAVMAEKPVVITNSENKKQLLKEAKQKQNAFITITLLIGLCLYGVFIDFDLLYAGLMLSTFAGFVVSVLIIQHELGISNSVTEQLCKAGKNTDCDAVLHSKKSKLLNWLNPADASFIWFSSLLFLLIISSFTGTTSLLTPTIAILTVCAALLTLFSLYYQWRVVKKWCTLCLLTTAVLWIQTVIMIPGLKNIRISSISINTLLLIVLLTLLISSLWLLLVKPSFQKRRETEYKNYQLQRLKNDSRIFRALLKQQRLVDVNPFEHDLQLGNPDAFVQIMVGCGLYCGPCAKAHKMLEEILHKQEIGLTFRFYVDLNFREDKRIKAIEYIFQLVNNANKEQKLKVLHDWYLIMNLENFRENHPLTTPIAVTDQLKEHEQWSQKSEIKFTPTIFINGYEMPKEYDIKDLQLIIRNLKDEVKETHLEI